MTSERIKRGDYVNLYTAYHASNSENLILLQMNRMEADKKLQIPVLQKAPIFGENYGYNYSGISARQQLTGTHPQIQNNMANAVTNNYHLGWRSIMGYTSAAVPGQITFNNGRDLARGQAIAGGGVSGTQIVTRGVSSCTVINVSLNNNHVMAHLDARDLIQASLAFITAQVPPPAPPVPGAPPVAIVHPQIFISLHDIGARRPAFFARQLIEQYYPGIVPAGGPPGAGVNLGAYLTNGVPAGHHIRFIDRTAVGSSNMFTHPELGMSMNAAGQMEAFGTLRGNDMAGNRHISTSDRRFTQGMAGPQASFEALSQEGQQRQTVADRWGRLYRFFVPACLR